MRETREQIDLERVAELERELRHDVMAHVHHFGEVAPEARGYIHLGATSAFVGDNAGLIQHRDALLIIRDRTLGAIEALADFAREHRTLPTVGYTHLQPAQPTTVGKRACLWLQDLVMDLDQIEVAIAELRLRGARGTTGTEATFLQLFEGDGSRVDALNERLADRFGFVGTYDVVGQTYPRKIDHRILGVLAGVEQVLMVNENWVSGHDVASGRVLWEFEWPGTTAADSNVSQAVPVPPDKVFVSKGYGAGAALYRLAGADDGTLAAEQLWQSSRVMRTKLTNVAIRDGYVYGLSEGVLECVDLATGERVWKAGRYHHGQILLVGDVLLVLSEDGELFMVEASPDSRNNVLGQIQAIEGHTWNTFALYGDIVVVRNEQEAAAYRLPLDLPLMFPVGVDDPLPEGR